MNLTWFLVFAVGLAGDAKASQSDGNDILAKVDEQLKKAKSQILTMEMAIQDPGREPRRIGMQMHMRGGQQRISFIYPGDMKGMRVLNISASQSYVYLPQFKKVRRVASHMKDQSMFGSDYNFEDFSTLAMHTTFSGEVTAESAGSWTIRATPRPGIESPYSRVDLTIDKKLLMPTQLNYFDAQGGNARTETRDDFQCSDDVCVPRRTKMINHRNEDHWTELTIKELQINTPFSEQIFSLRDLQRND